MACLRHAVHAGGSQYPTLIVRGYWNNVPPAHEYHANLELEINERLQVGGDELVEHEDRHHHDEADEPDGQQREIDPVPALPALRQPVDDHAQPEQREHDPIISQNVGDGRHVPVPANAVDHRLGGVPGGFIGHCRVQIGT